MTSPGRDEPDDLGEEYRRASALDPSRPGEPVRRAVLDHAAKLAASQLAAERAAEGGTVSVKPRPAAATRTPSRSRSRRRTAIFGSLAAASLAGILVAPHFLGRDDSPRPALTAAQQPVGSGSTAPAAEQPMATTAPSADYAPAAPPPPKREFAPAAKPAPLAAQEARVAADGASKSTAGAARNAAAAPAAAPPVPAASDTGAAMNAPAAADPAAAMRRAAENGDTRELTALLDEVQDIDAPDDNGRTALMSAILHGRAGAVEILLAHGADPNVADAHGTTPLQAASSANQPAIIRSLQRAGAR